MFLVFSKRTSCLTNFCLTSEFQRQAYVALSITVTQSSFPLSAKSCRSNRRRDKQPVGARQSRLVRGRSARPRDCNASTPESICLAAFRRKLASLRRAAAATTDRPTDGKGRQSGKPRRPTRPTEQASHIVRVAGWASGRSVELMNASRCRHGVARSRE